MCRLWLFRVQIISSNYLECKYFLKQLVVETHKVFSFQLFYLYKFHLWQLLIGAWVDELWINQLLGAPFFSLMVDEWNDVATVKKTPFFDVG